MNDETDPLCTPRYICAILDCAKLASDRIYFMMGDVWELLDAPREAKP